MTFLACPSWMLARDDLRGGHRIDSSGAELSDLLGDGVLESSPGCDKQGDLPPSPSRGELSLPVAVVSAAVIFVLVTEA